MSRSKSTKEMETVFVFDTETTGLPPYIEYKGRRMQSKFIRGKNIEGWPYIIQLSGIQYNLRTHEFKVYNKYIETERIPDSVLEEGSKVPIIKTALREYSIAKPAQRLSPEIVLDDFMQMVASSDIIVGHNVNFDKNLILAELKRLEDKHKSDPLLKQKYEMWYDNFNRFNNTVPAPKILYCTQCASGIILNINTSLTPKKTRRKRINYSKPPALWEAYDRIFGHPPLDSFLHNALVDIIVTLRVFYRLWMTGNRDPSPSTKSNIHNFEICGLGEPDIYGKDRGKNGKRGLITRYIDKITPHRSPSASPVIEGLHACSNDNSPYRTLPSGVKGDVVGGKKRRTRRINHFSK
jgi:DNA polymerase III epsilon subunit-like protein